MRLNASQRAARRIFRVWDRVSATSRGLAQGLRLRSQGLTLGKGARFHGPVRLSLADTADVRFGDRVSIGRDLFLQVGEGASVVIEADVSIGDGVTILCGGSILIGRGANLGAGTMVYCNGTLEIGEDSLIAAYAHIMDVDHAMNRADLPIIRQGLAPARPVRIGAGAWIGAKASVGKGVSIGDGAVIGANAVVTHDVPAEAIAVGVPARVIRSRRAAQGDSSDYAECASAVRGAAA